MTSTIDVLDQSGHSALAWNPDDPADVAHAAEAVENLRKAGYTFYRQVEGADDFGTPGRLIFEKVDDPITRDVPLALPSPTETPSTAETEPKHRKPYAPRKTIARPPQRGG